MRSGSFLVLVLLGLSAVTNAQNTNFITGCTNYNAPPGGSTISTCQTCASGYVLVNGGQQCNLCPTACSVCDTNNNCQTCASGNYLFAGSCYSCGVGCQTCNGQQCTACATGYVLANNNQCVQCAANCATCTAQGVCTNCNTGYALNNNAQGAQQCVFNNTYSGASPAVIVWLCVMFIACCLPFMILCCLFFRPSYHTGEPGMAYVPLTQKAEIPLVTQPVVTHHTERVTTTTVLPPGQPAQVMNPTPFQGNSFNAPGKGNTVRYTPGY